MSRPTAHCLSALGLADLIKISAADLRWFAPNQTLEQAAESLLDRGVALAVVTRGGEGVLAVRREGGSVRRITLPPFKVDVVDTVGAGDSFSGGFLASLAERGVVTREALERLPLDELERSLRFATAVSALTRTRAGADPPDRAAVDQFLAAQGVDNG